MFFARLPVAYLTQGVGVDRLHALAAPQHRRGIAPNARDGADAVAKVRAAAPTRNVGPAGVLHDLEAGGHGNVGGPLPEEVRHGEARLQQEANPREQDVAGKGGTGAAREKLDEQHQVRERRRGVHSPLEDSQHALLNRENVLLGKKSSREPCQGGQLE